MSNPAIDLDLYNALRSYNTSVSGQFGRDRAAAISNIDPSIMEKVGGGFGSAASGMDKLLTQIKGLEGFENTDRLTWSGDKLRAVAGDGKERYMRSVIPDADGNLQGSSWLYKPDSSVLADVAPYASIALNFIPGVGPLMAAAASGLLTKASGGSWGDALKSGALSYIGGQVGKGVGNFLGDAAKPALAGLDPKLADAALRGIRGVSGTATNDLLRGNGLDVERLLTSGLRGAVGPIGSWVGENRGIGSSLDAGGGAVEEGSFAPGGAFAEDGRAQPMDFDFGDWGGGLGGTLGDQPGDYDMPTTPDPTGDWWNNWTGGLGGTLGDQEGDYDMPTTPDPTGNWWENIGSGSGGALNGILNAAKTFGSNLWKGDADSIRQANMLLGLLGMADSYRNRGQGTLSVADARNMVASPSDRFSSGAQASMNKYFSSPLTQYKRPSPTQFGVNPFAPRYADGGGVAPQGFLNRVAEDVNAGGPVQGEGGGQDDLVEAALSPGEYVFDADVVSALGDGSNEEGARRLDAMRERIRAHKRSAPATEIPPRAKSPLAYLKEGA